MGTPAKCDIIYMGVFFMIHYRKILELHDEGISLRGIAASTGNSRQKVTEVIRLAEKKGLVCPLEEEMTDQWIEGFLFPEKTLEASGRQPLNFDYIHEELAKPHVTLLLLHHEYEAECRANNKIPYPYHSFLRHYGRYAEKYKATLPICRKPGKIMEVDWAERHPSSSIGYRGENKGICIRCDSSEQSIVVYGGNLINGFTFLDYCTQPSV